MRIGSEKANLVFEHPFQETITARVSMYGWNDYPDGKEMDLPRNNAIEFEKTYISEFVFPMTETKGPNRDAITTKLESRHNADT